MISKSMEYQTKVFIVQISILQKYYIDTFLASKKCDACEVFKPSTFSWKVAEYDITLIFCNICDFT